MLLHRGFYDRLIGVQTLRLHFVPLASLLIYVGLLAGSYCLTDSVPTVSFHRQSLWAASLYVAITISALSGVSRA